MLLPAGNLNNLLAWLLWGIDDDFDDDDFDGDDPDRPSHSIVATVATRLGVPAVGGNLTRAAFRGAGVSSYLIYLV